MRPIPPEQMGSRAPQRPAVEGAEPMTGSRQLNCVLLWPDWVGGDLSDSSAGVIRSRCGESWLAPVGDGACCRSSRLLRPLHPSFRSLVLTPSMSSNDSKVPETVS